MAGISFHIRCPACGQPFVTLLDHPQMAQACPFCQFNGLRGQFVQIGEVPLQPQRKESKRFAPSTSPVSAPHKWEVKQYSPPQQVPVASPLPYVPAPPPTQVTEPDWAAAQAYQEMKARGPRLAPLNPPVTSPPPETPPPPADWAPMKPSNLPKLTPWPGLDPDTGGPSAPAPWELAARKRGIPWGWLLIVLVIGGLITTLIIERKRANETTAKLSREIPAPTPQGNDPITDGSGTIAKALPVDEKKLPQECLLTPTESEALVRSLLDRLFSDAPNEDRLATIADAATNKESLASFFTKHPNVHLTHLSIISTPVRCLPAKAPQAIFDIMTTLSSKNSGIARLTTDDDGQLKLDWLLLQDSLDGAFASYQTQKPGVIPQWITLGLRRNHGFGEPADMRQENLFFDMQGYGNGGDKNMVLVVKNSSTGRAMDAAIGWGDLVIARVLIGWQNFKGVPRLTVINTILDESGVGS